MTMKVGTVVMTVLEGQIDHSVECRADDKEILDRSQPLALLGHTLLGWELL